MNASGQFSLPPTCTAAKAVDGFLASMRRAAERTFPAWLAVFKDGLEDCRLSYDARHAVFDGHPMEDLYFAAVVGLETARIRNVFEASEANDLLSVIAERVDAVAERPDRLVSDLVFHIVSHVDVGTAESQEKPHDRVIAILLARMGITAAQATRHLMTDILFRHHLGEPLAVQIPLWWPTFKRKYVLERTTPDHTPMAQIAPMSCPSALLSGAAPAKPARRRRIAQRLI
jgi:hypothetical protein